MTIPRSPDGVVVELAGAASAAVQRFLASADIETASPRKYRVVDPLYEEWIAKVDAGSNEGLDSD